MPVSLSEVLWVGLLVCLDSVFCLFLGIFFVCLFLTGVSVKKFFRPVTLISSELFGWLMSYL